MFSEPLAKIKKETKIKTSLRARGPPGVSGALCSVRILRIGRIGSGVACGSTLTAARGYNIFVQCFPNDNFMIGL